MGKSWGGRERQRRKKRYYHKRDDFRPGKGGIEKQSSAAKQPAAETRDYIKDPLAPAESNCAICEKNEIAARLRLEFSDPEIHILLDHYEDKSILIQKFSDRSAWKNSDYGHHCGKADDLRTALVDFAKNHPDPEKLEAAAKNIREKFWKNSGNKKFASQPQFYLKEGKNGMEKHGQFVTLNFSKSKRFFELPFLLGLELEKPHTLYACWKCLSELQTSLLETDKKSEIHPKSKKEVMKYWLKSVWALTYEDSPKRSQEFKEKKEEKRWGFFKRPTPEIINPEEEIKVSQSFFPIILDIFDEKTDRAVSNPGLSPSEVLNLALENLRRLSPEEMEEVKILLGQKRSNGKMPAHLGFPGGSQDPDEEPSASIPSLNDYLPPALQDMSKKNQVVSNLFQRTLEEFLDRTGFRPRKLYGRIIRLPKNETHVDQCLLMSAEPNQSQPIRKVQKMAADQERHWFTLNEIYGETAGYVSHNHKRILLAIFELHQLPMPKGMKEFQEKLK